MSTLLEKALAVPNRRSPNVKNIDIRKERFELALAYARGDLTVEQVCSALGANTNGGTMYGFLGSTFIHAIRYGWLVEAPEEKQG